MSNTLASLELLTKCLQSSAFGMESLASVVLGLGFRVQGSGFRV